MPSSHTSSSLNHGFASSDLRYAMEILQTLFPPRAHARRTAPATAPPGAGVADTLIEQTGSQRDETADFIVRESFRHSGIQVHAVMPRLFALRDGDGVIHGALGIRSGAGKLHVEQILDVAIDQSLAMLTACEVDRRAVVEIGQAIFRGGIEETLVILRLLTKLYADGFRWAVFDSTVQPERWTDRHDPLSLTAARIWRYGTSPETIERRRPPSREMTFSAMNLEQLSTHFACHGDAA